MVDSTLPRSVLAAALVAVTFGALTVVSGGIALFGGVDMGAVVPFVLWFNFLAGFAYIAAGLGLWFKARRAWWLCLSILVAALIVLAFFATHIARGGAFEPRTVGALLLRSGIWAAIATVAYRERLSD
jgi:hypothetical protein